MPRTRNHKDDDDATTTTTTAIPWAPGFRLPTAAQRQAAVGSFPWRRRRPDDAAHTLHRNDEDDDRRRRRLLRECNANHGDAHAGQIHERALFDPQPAVVSSSPPSSPQNEADWLAQVAEPGQTFDDYVDDITLPSGRRWKAGVTRTGGGLVLVPVITVARGRGDNDNDNNHDEDEDDEEMVQDLRRYLLAFLGESMPVTVSPPARLELSDDATTAKRATWIPPCGGTVSPQRWVTVRQHRDDDDDGWHRLAVHVESVLTCLTDLTGITPVTATTKGDTRRSSTTPPSSSSSPPHSVVGVLVRTDLYAAASDLFVAGLTAGGSHVAAFSLHRYHPHIRMSPTHWWRYGYMTRPGEYPYFDEDEETQNVVITRGSTAAVNADDTTKRTRTLHLTAEPPSALGIRARRVWRLRAVKLFSHEVLHLLSIEHCIFHHASCLMKGTGHLVEDFAAPPHLCAVDLRKAQFRLGFDVIRRYERLATLWREWKCPSQARWCERRARACRQATSSSSSVPTLNDT